MARRPRAEVEGGLYHVIARGNNRQDIFHSEDDCKKFLSLLDTRKAKLGFYLYAYCLMTNHFHLALERQAESVGRIMQRIVTGGLDDSTVSRRYDSARRHSTVNDHLRKTIERVVKTYRRTAENIAELQV